MSDFGAFLGKVAGKVVHAANSDRKLKCDGCNKITGHISISYADAFKAADDHDDNVWRDVFGVTMDFIPASGPLGLGNPYACCDCKKIRFEGGILSNDANKGSNVYL
jgi:hypothetical protein